VPRTIAAANSLALFVRPWGWLEFVDSHRYRISAKILPRRLAISRNLGDIVLFALYFHELFMKSVVRLGIQSRFIGRPLSYRERECLTLAARGLTTEDIGYKLGICTRTVQFHFDSIRSKLAVANRQEAVARAIRDGQISI